MERAVFENWGLTVFFYGLLSAIFIFEVKTDYFIVAAMPFVLCVTFVAFSAATSILDEWRSFNRIITSCGSSLKSISKRNSQFRVRSGINLAEVLFWSIALPGVIAFNFISLLYLNFGVAFGAGGVVIAVLVRQLLLKVQPSSIFDPTANNFLFLRNFSTDNTTPGGDPLLRTDERRINASLAQFGKVTSIANQKSFLPSLGASKIRLAEENWKQGVQALIRDSKGVILLVSGHSDSVSWELGEISAQSAAGKTLVLLALSFALLDRELKSELEDFLQANLDTAELQKVSDRVFGFLLDNDNVCALVGNYSRDSNLKLAIQYFLWIQFQK
ncbi:hypothetical protein KTN05_06650 [Paracoccus sp. Z118]|uniref:hypothetical protein n=1 Tax=Paracoccus sp. Z118 TaxID=2851017 RepID=UPI001C2B8DD6|nr:hypothetical protein [Paracoccus sp. Z118]MBV0891535.1 hypothetical protein [Paracoccus sp. Z118]